jgi:hypothetical protein
MAGLLTSQLPLNKKEKEEVDRTRVLFVVLLPEVWKSTRSGGKDNIKFSGVCSSSKVLLRLRPLLPG